MREDGHREKYVFHVFVGRNFYGQCYGFAHADFGWCGFNGYAEMAHHSIKKFRTPFRGERLYFEGKRGGFRIDSFVISFRRILIK